MRAIVSDGTAVCLNPNYPPPRPAAGEAIVRLRRAIIAPFDRATARGETGFVGVVGHQFVGVVETVHGDAAASRSLVNQRVVGSIVASCGECDLCRKGLGVHCRSRTLMGLCGADGCFAERFTIGARQLVTIPGPVDDDRAAFAFEVASALHTAQQLTIANRPYITVLGDGVQALLAGQVMSHLNATVRVVGTNPARLESCDKWGVKHRLLDDIGRRNDQDIVVDCTEAGDGLSVALGLVRPRGQIVLKSLRSTVSTQAPVQSLGAIVRHEIDVIGSFIGSVSEAVSVLSRREVDVVSMITRRVPLRDAVAALTRQSGDALATLLVFDE